MNKKGNDDRYTADRLYVDMDVLLAAAHAVFHLGYAWAKIVRVDRTDNAADAGHIVTIRTPYSPRADFTQALSKTLKMPLRRRKRPSPHKVANGPPIEFGI